MPDRLERGGAQITGTPIDLTEQFALWDSVTPEQLRARGGMKWSMFPGTIGAWVAESDLGTAPAIRAALHAALDADQLGYLPRRVAADMADATAEWMADSYGWAVESRRIHALPDVISGLVAAMEHFSAPGSAVIVPTPAYMPFLTVPAMYGRNAIEVPLATHAGRAVLDLEQIDRALVAGAGLVVLCNPLNPGGRVFDRAELVALSEVVERHGARVFADEVHAPIVFGDARHVPYASVSAAAAAHSITTTSASKAWNLPGVKAAQLILTNDADAALWATLGSFTSHGASTLGVIANTAAYREGREWLGATVAYYDSCRQLLAELLAERLPEVGYTPPEGTYIGWLDLSALELGENAAERLRLEARLSVTDGLTCGLAGAGFVRVILATPRPIIHRIVDAIATTVGR